MSVFSCHFYPFSRSLLLRLITSCYLFPPVGRKSLSPLCFSTVLINMFQWLGRCPVLRQDAPSVPVAWPRPACFPGPPTQSSSPGPSPREAGSAGHCRAFTRAALVDHHLSPKQDRPSAPRPSRPTRLDLLTSLGSKACHLRGGLWQCRILTHGARPGIAFRFTCPSHLCLSRNWAVQTVRC